MPFDPDEFPTPDLGLRCMNCGYPLGGLTECRCPECGRKFDYEEYIPPGDFPPVIVDGKNALLTPDVGDALRRAKIPFMQVMGAAENLYGLNSVTHTASRVGVPRSLYFDAVDVLRQLRDGEFALPPLDHSPDWFCPQCGEENPGTFELCWQCDSARPESTSQPG